MGGKEFSIFLVLASCFAMTAGIYIERKCDWEGLTECGKTMDSVVGTEEPDVLCPPMMATTRCLEDTKRACTEADGSISNAIQTYLDGMDTSKCQDAGAAVGVASFMNFAEDNDDTTTHGYKGEDRDSTVIWWKDNNGGTYRDNHHTTHDPHDSSPYPWREPGPSSSPNPWAEPGPSSSPNPWAEPGPSSSPNPWAEPVACTWDMYHECGNIVEDVQQETNMEQMCSVFESAKTCFEGYAHNCHDQQIKDPSMRMIESLHQQITMSCAQGGNEGCSMASLQSCTGQLQEIKAEKDPHENCRIWWHTKPCLSELNKTCTVAAAMAAVKTTWSSMEHHLDYCKHYTRCNKESRMNCRSAVEKARTVQDKCWNMETTMKCLHDLELDCDETEDTFERDALYSVDLAWIHKIKDGCMTGNMGGGGSLTGDGDVYGYGSAGTVSVTKTTILMAFVAAFVYKMASLRFC